MKVLLAFLLFPAAMAFVLADEPAVLTLENGPYSKRIVADEPVRETFPPSRPPAIWIPLP